MATFEDPNENQNLAALRKDISALHQKLAAANEKNMELHSKMESLHNEKIKAFGEVEEEMKRAEMEASKRREAELRVRHIQNDIKMLANSDDNLRFFQEAEDRRVLNEQQISSLRSQLHALKRGSSPKTMHSPPEEWKTELGEHARDMHQQIQLASDSSPADCQTVVSPKTVELEGKVEMLRDDLLEMSEELLCDREETTYRFEECIEVVEDAELTAEAAREVGWDESQRADKLEESAHQSRRQSTELTRELSDLHRRQRETELQLLETSLENEALRAQLASNGIKPTPALFREVSAFDAIEMERSDDSSEEVLTQLTEEFEEPEEGAEAQGSELVSVDSLI